MHGLARASLYGLAPCLIFDSLIRSTISGADFGRMALLCIVVTAMMGIVGRGVAVALRLIFEPWFLNYDARYALLWARDFWQGFSPEYKADFAPTPHPLQMAYSSLALPFGEAADDVLVFAGLLLFGALVYMIYKLGAEIFHPAVGVVAALVGQHADPSPGLRVALLGALGALKKEAAPALEALVPLLHASEEEVRQAAAAAVGQIGSLDEEHLADLSAGLASRDNVVRAQTAEVLGTIGPAAGESKFE